MTAQAGRAVKRRKSQMGIGVGFIVFGILTAVLGFITVFAVVVGVLMIAFGIAIIAVSGREGPPPDSDPQAGRPPPPTGPQH